MGTKLKKYAVVAKVSFSNAIAYRASVFGQFLFYGLFVYVFVRLWGAIYQGGGVQGYSYTQIVWYLVMTELIAFTCGPGIYRELNDSIKNGSIAYLIGRPAHFVFYQFADSLGQAAFRFVSFGALAAALGHYFVGPLPTFRLPALLPLALSVALAIVLHFFMLALIGLSAFVLEDNFALYLIYQKLGFMLGMFLPVEFLPAWLQPIAKALPFSYVYWAPAKLFVGYSPELFLELFPRQAAWAAASMAFAMLCYRLGVSRLQVNGG
jgi:ABC-2 type transport system permease protein